VTVTELFQIYASCFTAMSRTSTQFISPFEQITGIQLFVLYNVMNTQWSTD